MHFIGHDGSLGPAGDRRPRRDAEVILFGQRSISSSSGEVPTTFEKMGANAIAFVERTGTEAIDVLGFLDRPASSPRRSRSRS